MLLSPRQGIRRIQHLEEYTGLRVLWLEGNGLCKLEGMGAQTQLKTLYAHENLIEKIEGLESFLEASGFGQRDVNASLLVQTILATDPRGFDCYAALQYWEQSSLF